MSGGEGRAQGASLATSPKNIITNPKNPIAEGRLDARGDNDRLNTCRLKGGLISPKGLFTPGEEETLHRSSRTLRAERRQWKKTFTLW